LVYEKVWARANCLRDSAHHGIEKRASAHARRYFKRKNGGFWRALYRSGAATTIFERRMTGSLRLLNLRLSRMLIEKNKSILAGG
jgi:hypothetical protein